MRASSAAERRTSGSGPVIRATDQPVESTTLPFPHKLDDSLGATWRADLSAGVVVFLVALPLCLGIALASGAPLFSGLVTGIVGGLLVSRLSGSQLMVSGPAAGLTAIVAAAIIQLGSFEAFLAAVVLAGVLQLALGAVRAGIIGYFFPTSVIRGMLTAIGLILILKQLPYAFGAGISGSTAPSGGMLGDIATAVGGAVPAAVAIAIASLAVLVTWPKVVPQKVRQVVPAPLAVVLLGVGVSMLLAAVAPAWALPTSAFVSLPVPDSAAALLGQLRFPDFGALVRADVWRVAVTLGLVASLETLLSLEATDKLDPYKRTAPANRELLAQGAGNMVAGLAGGLPMTGVIVRSAANISAGGRTWRSSFVHGVLLLVAVAAIPMLLNRIPLATLAAVLLFTGYKLAHPRTFRDAWHVGPSYVTPFLVTVVAILVADLLVGIGIGLAVGAFFILLESYRSAYSYHVEESEDHHRVRIVLAEEVTFLNKAPIVRALRKLPEGCVAVVDGARSRYIDHDVLEILHEFHETSSSRGVSLRLVGIPSLRVSAAKH